MVKRAVEEAGQAHAPSLCQSTNQHTRGSCECCQYACCDGAIDEDFPGVQGHSVWPLFPRQARDPLGAKVP